MIEIIKKPTTERSVKENLIVTEFLEKTKLKGKLSQDKDNSESIFRIHYMCASNLNFKLLKKDEILFRLGELGDNMYFILSGSVMILKPLEVPQQMTAEQYLLHLNDLHDTHEIAFLRRTIAMNIDIYDFNFDDVKNIDKILLRSRFRFKTAKDKSVRSLEDFFVEYDLDPESFGININDLYQKEKNADNPLDIYTICLQKISYNVNYERYKYVEQLKEVNTVTTLEYEDFLDLKKGFVFGDHSMGPGQSKRNATIKGYSSESCLGFISSQVYKENVMIEDTRLKVKEQQFLIDNYFFRNLSRNIFDRKYFANFIKKELKRGECIFRQNEKVNFVYFVRQGELELSINRNYFEMFNIIQQLALMEDSGRDVTILFNKRFELTRTKGHFLGVKQEKEV